MNKYFTQLCIVMLFTLIVSCGGSGPNGDLDLDTILNVNDNCPNQVNADQADLDADGIGDVCDDDADGDGVLAADDCDDLNANTLPGASDFPDPDLIDANCDGMDGIASQAIWVAPDGDDVTGDGTITLPYKTLPHAVSQAELDSSKDVYVAKGNYNLLGSLSLKGVRIFGGYSNLIDGTRSRNVKDNLISLSGTATFGGLVNCMESVTGHESHIAGLKFMGGQDYPGLLVSDSSPLIEDNIFETPTHAGNFAYGVLIYRTKPGTISPVIRKNKITVGNATGPDGLSAGIFVANGDPASTLNAIIENNEIKVGKGTIASLGIHAIGTDPGSIVNVEIRDNKIEVAESKFSIGVGLGISFGEDFSSPDPIKPTIILFDHYIKQATLERNMILGEQQNTSIDTYGLIVSNKTGTGKVMIRNNVILSSLASNYSVGLSLQDVQAEVFNNTIVLSSSSDYIGLGVKDVDAAESTEVGAINNIFSIKQSVASLDNAVFYIEKANAKFTQIENNLTDPTFNYLFFDGVLLNIQDSSALNGLGFAKDNILEEPEFLDVSINDYHFLNDNSPGVGAAQNLDEVPHDLSGKTRDAISPSVGAYEF